MERKFNRGGAKTRSGEGGISAADGFHGWGDGKIRIRSKIKMKKGDAYAAVSRVGDWRSSFGEVGCALASAATEMKRRKKSDYFGLFRINFREAWKIGGHRLPPRPE
jgi:hypothetical protein